MIQEYSYSGIFSRVFIATYFSELTMESSELVSGKRKQWILRQTMNGTADVNKAPGGKGLKNGFPSWRSCIAL
jgi:hypothetical protein